MLSSHWLTTGNSGPMSGMERDTHKANISVDLILEPNVKDKKRWAEKRAKHNKYGCCNAVINQKVLPSGYLISTASLHIINSLIITSAKICFYD